MTKRPVNAKWFQQLRTGSLKDRLDWLAPLSADVDSLVSFGCCSSEPLALMWILDVSEAWVVELKDEHLNTLREDLQNLERLNLAGSSAVSGCMDGRSIRFIVGDMTRRSSLPSSHLDLAYCEDTLYEIHLKSRDLATVQSAVNEMTRVVKPGGWIIAWDTKIGRRRQQIERQWVPVGDPIDISPLFQAAGLVKACLEGAPKWSYCYKKPNRPAKQITGGSKCHVSSRPSLRPIIKR